MSAARPVRILVVEDDWFMAKDAVAAVRAAGCEVVGPFPCPVEAERSLAAHVVDAALLNIEVGDATTFDLARRLVRAEVPTVFHSDWPRSGLPADLAVVPLVPKWKGAAAAVATLQAGLSA